jgi:prepilin-type N-terminal cleavage/methylation domain-containing protein
MIFKRWEIFKQMKWMRQENFSKSCSGFTLVEVMTVIAIMGIMAATSISLLIKAEPRARKAARELMGDMQTTRISAIKTNQDWAIVFDPAACTYYICSDRGTDNVWSTITASNTIEKTVCFTAYGKGVQFGSGIAATSMSGGAFGDGVSYNSNVLTFNSRGTCSSGYVYLFYGQASYAVGTLSTGIVRIRHWSGGSWR